MALQCHVKNAKCIAWISQHFDLAAVWKSQIIKALG